MLLGERHLRHAMSEYVEHYHAERCHQGIGNRPIDSAEQAVGTGEVHCRRRLGGLLNHYYRVAA